MSLKRLASLEDLRSEIAVYFTNLCLLKFTKQLKAVSLALFIKVVWEVPGSGYGVVSLVERINSLKLYFLNLFFALYVYFSTTHSKCYTVL